VNKFEQVWSSRGPRAWLLLPVSLLYGLLVRLRRGAYTAGVLRTVASPLPVVVVGNISVGGTGKSPLIQALVEEFQARGWRPGIVSRGYGGVAQASPTLVTAESLPAEVGDEPVMHARNSRVPVCVCVHRAQAVAHLAEHTDVSLVLADDGLQHYAMARTAEIAVVDGARGLGNGWLLPAGSLREPGRRLLSVDIIAVQRTVTNPFADSNPLADSDRNTAVSSLVCTNIPGLAFLSRQPSSPPCGKFSLQLCDVINLQTGEVIPLQTLSGRAVHAMAGLGYPQRFFNLLTAAGLEVKAQPMPDHHVYVADDILFDDALPLLVTAKDAVKIRHLGVDTAHVFEVRVRVQLDEVLQAAIGELDNTLRESVTHSDECQVY
jgi:tetraacyldisaccharide 4'-kinase